jgi:4-hydroxymandelate oxidase
MADREATAPLVSVADVEQLGEARLPLPVRDFIGGGSGAELTRLANRAALDELYLVPRVMVDASICDAAATLLGTESALPVVLAPMAYQLMVHPDGEVGLATACAQAGIPYTATMLSSMTVEEIAKAGGRLWSQLYWLHDRGLMVDLIRRYEAAGSQALVLTVDVPVLGRRLRDLRNGFALPDGVHAANLAQAGPVQSGVPGQSAVANFTGATFDESLNWSAVAWLAEQTNLPLVLKGVLDPDDARRAADLGVAGIVVSNHGGRQLDGAVPSITALPWVVEAVAGRCQVLFDSGIRGGMDVLKAIALGADAVMLGRPALWGLAIGGTAAAARVLTLLAEELRLAMALAGCHDLAAARTLRTVTRRT